MSFFYCLFLNNQSEYEGLIREFALQWNKIGVEGAKKMAEALSINNTLTTLNLVVRFVYFLNQPILKTDNFIEIQHSQFNEIGDEGAKNLAEALSINNTLTILDLEVRFV